MGKTVNIGQLREPINIVSYTMVDDGMGGFVQDGDPIVSIEFSSWKQVSEGKKVYLGLEVDTNYFEVILRKIDIPKSAHIERDGVKYNIQKIQESQNLSGPAMLTITVSQSV